MGTKLIRVPDTLPVMVEEDLNRVGRGGDPPGPVLLRAYDQYRVLEALAKVLRDRGFTDGNIPIEIVRNYVAYADNCNIDLKEQLIKTQDERDQYETFFRTLWEMFLKGDALGIRTTLPSIVNGILKKNGG